METFLDKHAGSMLGVLSGLDRILFRGLLTRLCYVDGFDGFLGGHGVLYKNYSPFVQRVSRFLKEHAIATAKAQGRPYRYLKSSAWSKEEIARRIMEEDKIEEGLICVRACLR